MNEGGKHNSKVRERLWEERFQQLVEYKMIHGNTNVPIGWEHNTQLATWVSTQRHEYNKRKAKKNTRMTDSRILRLNEIGFVWKLPRGPRKQENDHESPAQEVHTYVGQAAPMSSARIPIHQEYTHQYGVSPFSSPLLNLQSTTEQSSPITSQQILAATRSGYLPLETCTGDSLSLVSKAIRLNGSNNGAAVPLQQQVFQHTLPLANSNNNLERNHAIALQSLLLQRQQAEEQYQRAAALRLLASTVGSTPVPRSSTSVMDTLLSLQPSSQVHPTTSQEKLLLAAALLQKQQERDNLN